MKNTEKKIKLGKIEIIKPRQIIYDILKYKKKGTVLDLGAAWGRHALFLAHKGFQVMAVNSEKEAVVKIKQRVKESGLKVVSSQSDIREYETKKRFDVVIATMVLHFLSKCEVAAMIKKMQDWTSPNGLNVILVYTDKNPKGLRKYLFKPKELASYYKTWDILQYSESWGRKIKNRKDGGPEKRHTTHMITQKLS